MPIFKSVAVDVRGDDGQPLAEWGKQNSRNIVSCYIQSKTDMQFAISIAPADILARQSRPYQLLATLRLDGRELPERSCIIYLDKSHPYYRKSTNGGVTMEGRKMCDAKGNMRMYRWVFREIGIESLLVDLDLNLASTSVPDQDPLLTQLQGLGASDFAEKAERSKAGCIEIELRRVNVAEKADYREPREDEYTRDTGRGDKAGKDISHSTDRTAGEEIKYDTSYITYWPYIPEGTYKPEGTYAKFKFFYRSEEVLRKYDFDGFMPMQPKRVDRVNQSLARSLKMSPTTKRSLEEGFNQRQIKHIRSTKTPNESAVASDSDSDGDSDKSSRFTFSVSKRQPKMPSNAEAMTSFADKRSGSVERDATKPREKPTLQWNQQEGASNAMQLAGEQAARRGSHKENDRNGQAGQDEDEVL